MSMNKSYDLRVLLSFLQPLFGAFILLWFFFWLKTRQVKDTSLLWLFLTLVTAAFPGLVLFLAPEASVPWLTLGIVSPLCNVVMTMTAFRLLRIRELVRHNVRLRLWPPIVQWTVIAAATAVSIAVLVAGGQAGLLFTLASRVDSLTSLIALATMATCLSYSFYKYGNQPLIVLTVADFAYIVAYQFEPDSVTLMDPQVIAALNITSVSVLTMLFIALTLSWGMSRRSRLKFNESHNVSVIVMSVDLRGSTRWAKEIGDGPYVVTFMDKFTHWMDSKASGEPYGSPTVKHTGDGMMFFWEVTREEHIIMLANAVVGLACALWSGYQPWVRSRPELYKEVPRSIGIGVDFGSAVRLTSESADYEYIGLPANFAAKFQELARPDGGVVVRDNWALSDELDGRFVHKGKVEIAGEFVPVRATFEVKFASDSDERVH
ncbi:MAG TPA: hypothetical protein VI306_09870 [Pyrinomonadaceae bacterium]